MTERRVHLRFTKAFTDKIPITDKGVCAAIGYLSAWAAHADGRLTHVRIFGDAKGDVWADYFAGEEAMQNNERAFEMYGMRRPDGTYSFHS